MATGFSIVLTTCDSDVNAKQIAAKLLEEKLAACIQILPIESFYEWKGSMQNDKELLLFIKCKELDYTEIEKCIKSIHSYEAPEIIEISISNGSNEYLSWITSVTK